MKELSIEEKAKAYDELLKKLQEAKVDNNVCDERYCCVIDDIVPELKESESEDEKIRKRLIEFFKDWGKTRSHCWSIYIPDILAWLDKQSGKKSAWSEDDEKRIKNILSVLDVQVCWDGATGEKKNPYQKEIDWLKSLKSRVQPKQEWSEENDDEAWLNDIICKVEFDCTLNKDEKNWLKSLKDRIQARQEWSEEDKDMLRMLLEMINYASDHYQHDDKATDIKAWVLKSLKDRVGCEMNCTTTKEWSEEDEATISRVISIVKWAAYNGHSHPILNNEGVTELIDRLKSLRPQSQNIMSEDEFAHIVGYLVQDIVANEHMPEGEKQPTRVFVEKYYNKLRPQNRWKPSDEQIMALRWVLNHIPYDSHKEEISGLLEQLKKLREE